MTDSLVEVNEPLDVVGGVHTFRTFKCIALQSVQHFELQILYLSIYPQF